MQRLTRPALQAGDCDQRQRNRQHRPQRPVARGGGGAGEHYRQDPRERQEVELVGPADQIRDPDERQRHQAERRPVTPSAARLREATVSASAHTVAAASRISGK